MSSLSGYLILLFIVFWVVWFVVSLLLPEEDLSPEEDWKGIKVFKVACPIILVAFLMLCMLSIINKWGIAECKDNHIVSVTQIELISDNDESYVHYNSKSKQYVLFYESNEGYKQSLIIPESQTQISYYNGKNAYIKIIDTETCKGYDVIEKKHIPSYPEWITNYILYIPEGSIIEDNVLEDVN